MWNRVGPYCVRVFTSTFYFQELWRKKAARENICDQSYALTLTRLPILVHHAKSQCVLENVSSSLQWFLCLGYRCTNQTEGSGSTSVLSLHQDRPHTAEGMLWLHMLHHVAWIQTVRALRQGWCSGRKTKLPIPQKSVFPDVVFIVR